MAVATDDPRRQHKMMMTRNSETINRYRFRQLLYSHLVYCNESQPRCLVLLIPLFTETIMRRIVQPITNLDILCSHPGQVLIVGKLCSDTVTVGLRADTQKLVFL